ncbi:DUF2281 domain-containing protein [Rivularia sp. UHCC 0363]|uniref:DUF2281 domain-containing protein n=1 Tax=Rivularia sp. UHCC 0363 TaxID=3110244 RepID=UPI002B1F0529|nr:DUF2281 domain-containing protein [Rivularia sp. UHCC 0363]MEA5595579.1 DUF2281 domain-containing protein [Rivularia sp. UHCC 0363]
MTVKEQIIQELEHIPESKLTELLDFIRSFRQDQASSHNSEVWNAYLDSEREREEVYRRLADS